MSDETNDKSDEELRAEVAEEVGKAHLLAAFYVRFPRDDNDLEELDATSAQLTINIDSKTELLAGESLMEDALNDMADRAESAGSGSAFSAAAMPLPDGLAEQLMGMSAPEQDEEDESNEGRGFA